MSLNLKTIEPQELLA